MPRVRRRKSFRGNSFERGTAGDAEHLASSAPRGPGHFENERDRSRSAHKLNALLANRIRLTKEVLSNTKHIAETSTRPPNYNTVKRNMHDYISFRGKALFAQAFDLETLWDVVQVPVKQVLREVDAMRGAIGRIEQQRGFCFATEELQACMRDEALLSSRPLLRMGHLSLRKLAPQLPQSPPCDVTVALFPDILVVMDAVKVDVRSGDEAEATSNKKHKKKKHQGSKRDESTCTIWAVIDLNNARVEDSTLKATTAHDKLPPFVVRGASFTKQHRHAGVRLAMESVLELSSADPDDQFEWMSSICRVLRQNLQKQVPHGLSITGLVGSTADWIFTHLVTCGTACHAALIGNNSSIGVLSSHLETMAVLDEDSAAQVPQASAATVATATSNALAAAATMRHCAAVGGNCDTLQLLEYLEEDHEKYMSSSSTAGMGMRLSPNDDIHDHGPDGLAPIHCALLCANVPVLTELLGPYAVRGSNAKGKPAFSDELLYQHLAGPLHFLPYCLDAFQHFLLLESCGTFDLSVPGFCAQPWHVKSAHFQQEYQCNVFDQGAAIGHRAYRERHAQDSQRKRHLSSRGYAAIASMVHDLSDAGIDPNLVIRVAPGHHRRADDRPATVGRGFVDEPNPFASKPQRSAATSGGSKPELPPVPQRVKTKSQQMREAGNLVFGGGAALNVTSSGRSNPSTMVGKAPLHLLCEFVGVATPLVLTTAAIAFQDRSAATSDTNSKQQAAQYQRYVDIVSKTFTGTLRALLNVGAIPNMRTVGGATAVELLLRSTLDSLSGVRYSQGHRCIREPFRHIWQHGIYTCIQSSLHILVAHGARVDINPHGSRSPSLTGRDLVERWAAFMHKAGPAWQTLLMRQQYFCDGVKVDGEANSAQGAIGEVGGSHTSTNIPPLSNELAIAFQRSTGAVEAKKESWHGNTYLKGSDVCEHCAAKLGRGTRHHCRLCASLVCAKCSPVSFALLPQGAAPANPGKIVKPVRVCCACYNSLSFQLRGFLLSRKTHAQRAKSNVRTSSDSDAVLREDVAPVIQSTSGGNSAPSLSRTKHRDVQHASKLDEIRNKYRSRRANRDQKVQEVQDNLSETVDKLVQRGAAANEMQIRAQSLSNNASEFLKAARRLNQR